MIRVFSFVPSNGAKTFDCTKASWNSKGGHRDQEKATFHFRRVGTEVYSFECPSGTGSGEWVNFEVMPAGGDTNMQWHQNKHSGFYIEII